MCPRVVFNTLFGLSVNYWMAIATRFLLGALNGLLGPIKVHNFSELLYGRQSNLMLHRFSIYVQAYAIEVCRPEHEALALSLVTHKLYTDRSPIPHIYIYSENVHLPAAILGQHGMGDRPHHRPSSWRLPCTGTYYFRANAQSIYLSN